jgi:hypothetical protein
MKNIHKNPILYYIAMPVLVGLWPLLVWAVFLPNAQKNLDKTKAENDKAVPIMWDILTLDPSLSEVADPNENTAEFNYDNVVFQVASLCNIPPSNCNLNARSIQAASGQQKTQAANVSLKQTGIVTFARFLSTIQARWPNLQCTSITLTQKPGLPDIWDIDIEFKYYY